MTWTGQNYYCDNCRSLISGTEGDPVCDSVCYAPNDRPGFDLCQYCSQSEQVDEERNGSNDMPERVKRYRRHRMSLL